MTTKVALYCRVSTTDQHPENQVRTLTDLAEKRGAEIVATFIDKGISGVKKDRDALNQMLSARGFGIDRYLLRVLPHQPAGVIEESSTEW